MQNDLCLTYKIMYGVTLVLKNASHPLFHIELILQMNEYRFVKHDYFKVETHERHLFDVKSLCMDTLPSMI